MREKYRLAAAAAIALFVSACGGGGGDAPPTPPRATSAALTLDEDSSAQGTMTGVAGEGGALSFAVQTQPASGTLAVSGADFTYTPNADFFGADTFTFIATESGRNSSPATITLNVTGINDAPVSADSAISTDEDIGFQGDVSASDVDGDTLTITVQTPAANGTVTPGAGTAFSYQPAANFFGTDSFVYTISDSTVSTQPATVTIDVVPVNDPPVVADAASSVAAGTSVVLDIRGTDVENDTLIYQVTNSFSTAVLTNDPATTGMLELDLIYGTWGADQATFVANDGVVDSAAATIDLTIEVPVTTGSIDVQSYDGQFNLSVHAVQEGPNDSVFVMGNVFGELQNPSMTAVQQQFVAVHDASGARVKEVYLGSGQIANIASGVNNGLFSAIGIDVIQELNARVVSLDVNNDADTDVQFTVPFAISRTNTSLNPLHVPGIGYYILANDNRLTWVNYSGAIQSTVAIPAPPSDLVQSYTVDDTRIVNNLVYIVGGIFECTDDGSQCFGGNGSKGYLLAADTSGNPQSIVELPGFPKDAAILDDGRVVAHIGESLYLIGVDSTVVWQRTLTGVFDGFVGSDGGGDLFWWAYNSAQGTATTLRVTLDNAVVWQTENPITVLGTFWPNDMAVDAFGNMFVSFIDRYDNSGTAAGRLVNAHVDYSGVHQWTEISEPSDLNANTDSARRSVLTTDYRFVSIAEDFIPGAGPDNDGFVFFNTIRPVPP